MTSARSRQPVGSRSEIGRKTAAFFFYATEAITDTVLLITPVLVLTIRTNSPITLSAIGMPYLDEYRPIISTAAEILDPAGRLLMKTYDEGEMNEVPGDS